MYDAMNEPHEFVGESREDAIARACKFFGVSQDALEINEFRPGEVYGLGGRSAVVAAPRNRPPVARGGNDRGERGDRGDRERGDRGDRGRGRGDRGDRGDRGGRGDGPRRGSERGEGRGDRGMREDSVAASHRDDVRPAAPSEPSIGSPRGELGEVGRWLLGVIERMELGPFQIGENADGDLLVIDVTGAAARALATAEGRPAEALQLLANQASTRTDLDGPRIVLEIEGDTESDSRETLLSRLAEKGAKRARETGRAVALDPMNGKDRRIIHIALRGEDDIATMSIGEGRYRQVVVVPAGAPEYEQARREAAASAQRNDG